jgi:hypothetical protein
MAEWSPVAVFPPPKGDLLLWVPPDDLLADLRPGHYEVGRYCPDGRATHWMLLPTPPTE